MGALDNRVMLNSKMIPAPQRYLLALGLLLLSSCVVAEDKPCTARDSDGSTYDLSSLTATSLDWKAHDSESGSKDFALNVCHQVLSETWNVASPETIGIYLQGPPSQTHGGESLGQYNTTLRIQEQGVSLVYTGGSSCPGGREQKSSIIYFPCTTDAGTGKPRFIGSLNDCSYFFEWPTAASCPTSRPWFSFWSLFVSLFTILLLASGLYIVIGSLYRFFIDRQRGLDILPPSPLSRLSNAEGLGGNIREGLEFARDIAVIGAVTIYEGLKNAYGRITGKTRAGGFRGLPSDAEEARTLFGDDDEDER